MLINGAPEVATTSGVPEAMMITTVSEVATVDGAPVVTNNRAGGTRILNLMETKGTTAMRTGTDTARPEISNIIVVSSRVITTGVKVMRISMVVIPGKVMAAIPGPHLNAR